MSYCKTGSIARKRGYRQSVRNAATFFIDPRFPCTRDGINTTSISFLVSEGDLGLLLIVPYKDGVIHSSLES